MSEILIMESFYKRLAIVFILLSTLVISCESDAEETENEKITQLTIVGDGVVDIQGNTYKTIIINSREWMAENIRCTLLNDGAAISHLETSELWDDFNDYSYSAYCYYNNDSIDGGVLYKYNTARNICPDGWGLPTDDDWRNLQSYIAAEGYQGVEIRTLKSTSLWLDDGNGTDLFGFNALPVGERNDDGLFTGKGNTASWWILSTENADNASGVYFSHAYSNSYGSYYGTKDYGYSVRCIRDL